MVPDRVNTAGDSLLARLPAGAQLLVELDLARLRANPVVGDALGAWLDRGVEIEGAPAVVAAPLAGVEAVVLAAYRVGTADASTITVATGGTPPSDAVELGEGVWGLAAEGDTARLLAVAAGASLADDARLLAVRARAMPIAAEGAAVRVAARLDPTASRALAGALEVAAMPATLSLWGDVADDLAVVVDLADPGRSWRWVPDATRFFRRIAALDEVRDLGLARPITAAEPRRDADGARWTMVVDPGLLRRVVRRFREQAPLSARTILPEGTSP